MKNWVFGVIIIVWLIGLSGFSYRAHIHSYKIDELILEALKEQLGINESLRTMIRNNERMDY